MRVDHRELMTFLSARFPLETERKVSFEEIRQNLKSWPVQILFFLVRLFQLVDINRIVIRIHTDVRTYNTSIAS